MMRLVFFFNRCGGRIPIAIAGNIYVAIFSVFFLKKKIEGQNNN